MLESMSLSQCLNHNSNFGNQEKRVSPRFHSMKYELPDGGNFLGGRRLLGMWGMGVLCSMMQ